MSPGGRIKSADVDAVRERTDIVQLISEYIPLKKSGRQFSGPCPFHQEKDPSFYVDPAKGVYHCFGCKAGGNAFNFVMELDGLQFNEAVERLADRIGYRVTYEASSAGEEKARSEKERLLRANRTAAEYYHYLLAEAPEGEAARDYLQSRGITRETAEEYQLGFAPAAWDEASRFLVKKGFSGQELVKAGLARERTRGQKGVYDVFRNRVVFPIQDHRGRVVAFSGRTLGSGGPEDPKYLNSPETAIYRKGHVLFGLNQARSAIQESSEAIVVEGNVDVLALNQAGLKATVAPLGTALTENHFDLLARLCDRIYLAFDADPGGIKAALRPVEFFNRYRIDVCVIELPPGEDPDSLVRSGGAAAFLELKAKAESLLDFAARVTISRYDISSAAGRQRAMEACAPLLSRVSGDDMRPVRDDLVRKLSGWLDMPRETVMFYLRKSSQPRGGRQVTAPAVDRNAMEDKVEKEALKLLLHDPEALLNNQELDPDYFTNESNKKIFELLKDILQFDEEVLRADYDGLIRRMVEGIEDKSLRGRVTQMLVEPLPQCDPGYEDKVFERLTINFLKRLKRGKEFEISRIDKSVEPKKYQVLCGELLELDQVIKGMYPYDHR